ncbi:MAG: bifunctional diguanylate cyclase/phosphodiesterase, partial [Micromonosporaceae bacterium]|nr:bifunctional diguanylate cyclase/phosphodiesterase [Micromonosporaceae bacterium]
MPALTRVIVEPARLAQVTYATGLPELIAQDASQGPGGLPLLEFTLTELWAQQRRRQITFDDYHTLGCVVGVLNRHAERVYRDLTRRVDEATIRSVLLRMVRSRGGAGTAVRIVARRESFGADWAVVEALAEPTRRLVVLGPDRRGAATQTAEIAHESLIREWRRLSSWVNDDADFQRWLAVVEERTIDDELLSDSRIGEAHRWLAARPTDVPPEVVALVERSTSALQRRIHDLEEARRHAADLLIRERILRDANACLVAATGDTAVVEAVRGAVRRLLPPDTPCDVVLLGDQSAPPVGCGPGVQVVATEALDDRWSDQFDGYSHALWVPVVMGPSHTRTTGGFLVLAAHALMAGLEAPVEILAAQAAAAFGRIAMTDEANLRSQLERELTMQALHDSLTGLANRTLFLERLRQALRRRSRTGLGVGIMIMDLDDFKAVNEVFGHAIGDSALTDLGQRVATVVGAGHTVARLSGDEFAALMDGADRAELERMAQRVLASTAEPLVVNSHVVRLTASIGLACADAAGTAEDLLGEAEVAMNEAKRAGGNQWRRCQSGLRSLAAARLALRDGLEHAMVREELRLHYQPIVELHRGRIVELQALLRWMHPEHGLLTPMDFIPLAEESGLSVSIGTWTLEHAIAAASRWQHQADATG